MPNVVAIVRDDRTRRQIEQFLAELEDSDIQFETFKTVDEFEGRYFKKVEPPPETAPFAEIHLLIFALDTISGKSGSWIEKTKAKLHEHQISPQGGITRMTLLKYEDDGLAKVDLIHPGLDDLIFLPLDRLIFLQKIEILLTMPKLVKPSFLFSQDVNHAIEISKIVKVDRLSDVALAIRNPLPLKRGLPGKFYLQLPGEKTRIDLRGKVIRSEPHPENPGQFLVYFGYFALDKQALTQIRRALAKAPRYQSLKSEDRELVRHKPDSLFGNTTTERVFNIAIVDPDEISGNGLAQNLAKEMDRLHILTESSYSYFLHKYFAATGPRGKDAPPQPTDASDFYSSPVSLSVSTTDYGCVSVEPKPGDTDLFLNHSASALFGAGDAWLSVLKDSESKMILEEAIQLAARGRILDKLLILRDLAGERRAVNCKIYKGTTDQVVTLEITPGRIDDIMKKMTSEDSATNLDVMIVDSSFVPEDSSAWIEGLRTRAVQIGMIERPENLKFLLVAEPDARLNDQWLASPDILGVFVKPVDNRQMLFYLSEILGNKNTLFQFDNLGWTSPSLTTHVAKAVRLEALSEYGATLRSPTKLTTGSVFFLRKSIYESAPNNCLAARVYACNLSPEKDGFQVYVTYFGINEAFLKYARTWIRENYAHQKAKGGG